MSGLFFFFFSSRRRHTRSYGDWSSDVCSSDLNGGETRRRQRARIERPPEITDATRTDRPDPPRRRARGWRDRARAIAERRAHRRVLLPRRRAIERSEERRVGKEGGCWRPAHQ